MRVGFSQPETADPSDTVYRLTAPGEHVKITAAKTLLFTIALVLAGAAVATPTASAAHHHRHHHRHNR